MKPLHELTELSVTEAAELLEMTVQGVRKACVRGDLPARRKKIKVWCIDINALRERNQELYESLSTKHAAKIAGKCIYCGR